MASGFWPSCVMGGRGLITPGGGGLTDTFDMARRQSFFPQLNTAESGTWGWSGSSSKQFGGAYENSSASSGDYVEWENVPLAGVNAKLKLLYTKSSNGGIVKILWNGDELGTLDTYNGSTTYNNVSTVDLGTVTAGRGTLRLISNTKHASSSAYKISVQQVELVQLTGSMAGASLDDLPFVSDVPPIGFSAGDGVQSLSQDTTNMWGSNFYASNTTSGKYIEYKVWLAEGTHTLSIVHYASTNRGIATVTIDGGGSEGTIDMYAASGTQNVVGTVAGIVIAETGIHTLRLTWDTKNASSSQYRSYINWIQFRKTAETGAITATGATYGRETMELWPWFADTTDDSGFNFSSNYLYYGASFNSSDEINDAQSYAVNCLAGTYDVTMINRERGSSGIVHLSNGGADLDTVDTYYASGDDWTASNTLSGALVPGTVQLAVDSKNASSSGYRNYVSQIRLVRTGA